MPTPETLDSPVPVPMSFYPEAGAVAFSPSVSLSLTQ